MILAILLVAAFMGQFDFFVVNVAAPAVQEALGARAVYPGRDFKFKRI